MIWEAHLDSKIETNTQGPIASNKQHNLPSINNRNKVNHSPPTPPHPPPHQRCMTCVCVQVQEERAVAEHDVCVQVQEERAVAEHDVCVQVQEERAVA